MLRRSLAGLVSMLLIGGILLAEETRGTITKVESGAITIRTGGGFGAKKEERKEVTLKVGGSTKVTRSQGKDKEAINLTLDELKTAVKVTTINVTVVHEGDNASEIKVGGFGFGGGGFGGGKKKKTDDK